MRFSFSAVVVALVALFALSASRASAMFIGDDLVTPLHEHIHAADVVFIGSIRFQEGTRAHVDIEELVKGAIPLDDDLTIETARALPVHRSLLLFVRNDRSRLRMVPRAPVVDIADNLEVTFIFEGELVRSRDSRAHFVRVAREIALGEVPFDAFASIPPSTRRLVSERELGLGVNCGPYSDRGDREGRLCMQRAFERCEPAFAFGFSGLSGCSVGDRPGYYVVVVGGSTNGSCVVRTFWPNDRRVSEYVCKGFPGDPAQCTFARIIDVDLSAQTLWGVSAR